MCTRKTIHSEGNWTTRPKDNLHPVFGHYLNPNPNLVSSKHWGLIVQGELSDTHSELSAVFSGYTLASWHDFEHRGVQISTYEIIAMSSIRKEYNCSCKICFTIVRYVNYERALDSRTRTIMSTRFSHTSKLSACQQASVRREKSDTVVILVRGFAKMLSCQKHGNSFCIFRSATRLSYQQ